jgi:1-phosphatidylinositol-4-phosphate 5-kinase
MNQFKHVAEQVVQKSLDVTSKVVNQISKNTTSVFGAAPSLSQMRAMNKINKDKKVLFRGATFWYYFRVYYPFMCPAIFLTFMIISLTAWNTIEGHLVMGSILSLIGGLSVISSYIMIVPWQKHPSVLVVYRTLTNMIFSLVIILEAITRKEESCRNFATITNNILLASESWLTTIASDLVHSLTNPFASYKANLRRYHILVWSLSGLISFIFYFDKACQGRFDNSICWVKVTSTNEPCLWGYYLFWIVCMYAYQMWAFIFAYLRLRRGLSVTFEVRKKTAQETFKCLASYAVYLSLLMFFFTIISSDPTPKPHSSMANFSLFFLFVISNRGTVDSVIWFMLHDFLRDPPAGQTVDPESGIVETHPRSRKSVTPDLHDLSKIVHQVDIQNVKKTVTTAVTDIAELAIAEFDETDLSPQVNMALRQQIVQYVTTGVRDSILQQNILTRKKQQGGVDSFMEKIMNPRTKDPAAVPGISVLKFYIDGEHTFKAFGIEVFKSIRLQEGISDEHYLASLSKPANERLSEGASGAFMFFCGGGEFIVKTIRAREAKVLHQSLDKYTKYLRQNHTSFLCRFVGSYSLRLYDQTFYFVVMMNCFDPHAKINERYDIKGSWVGRSADPPSSKQTKRVVCRHCNTYFVPVQQQQCTVIVGLHEPNIVLKDNDLRARISLDPKQAVEVVNILKRDSDLLGELGVMDYR